MVLIYNNLTFSALKPHNGIFIKQAIKTINYVLELYNKDLKLSKIMISIILIYYKLIVASKNLICNHNT